MEIRRHLAVKDNPNRTHQNTYDASTIAVRQKYTLNVKVIKKGKTKKLEVPLKELERSQKAEVRR